MVDDKDGPPVVVRKTLKLGARVARNPVPEKIPVKAAMPDKPIRRPTAQLDWAAEHKRKMQAEMDALAGPPRKPD